MTTNAPREKTYIVKIVETYYSRVTASSAMEAARWAQKYPAESNGRSINSRRTVRTLRVAP